MSFLDFYFGVFYVKIIRGGKNELIYFEFIYLVGIYYLYIYIIIVVYMYKRGVKYRNNFYRFFILK